MKETLSFPEREIDNTSLPVSSLHLLVPPLQLFSAAMWQVLQQQCMLHYGKLDVFVSLVMELFPELLSESQRTELTLGLQHMGPAETDCKTDPALEVLLWEFLTRLNQLLPVPDLKQTVSWLCAAPSVLEVCVQSDFYIDQLKTLRRPQEERSHEQLDKNETLPSWEECKLSDMGLPLSQRVVDSAKLTNTNIQSQSITACMNGLNPSSSDKDIKAECVMDSSDCTGAEPQSSLNKCENVEERTQRKTGYMMSRKQKDILTNMKEEEEDGESQSLKMEREDDASYEEGYRKEEGNQMDEQMDGNKTGQAAQTDNLVQNRVSSEHGQQEREMFTVVTSCLLKQPKVLTHQLENSSSSVPMSPPAHSVVTPLRANGSLRLKKDQVMTQMSKSVGQLERPIKNQRSSAEIRMCAEVSLSSSAVSSMEQNTGQTVEESSQVFSCSQCPSVHTEEVNFHQHVEKVQTEDLGRTLGSQPPPSSTHQYPTPTQSHTGSSGAHGFSQCEKSFSQTSQLKLHQQPHKWKRPHSCSQCGKSFFLASELKRHQEIHTGERAYLCSECGKSFIYSYLLKRHQRTRTRERPYLCSQCGKSFSYLCGLKKHQQTHTGKPTHSCSQCGKTFRYSCRLKKHQGTHTRERPYPCSQCGKSFARSDTLKQHQRTHTEERPYHCPKCGKSFIYSCRLKKHWGTHTGEHPYLCSQCGKSFSDLCGLKKHQQTHTGEPTHPCSQCGKSFRYSCRLKKHQGTHTRERPYPCSQCGKSFARSDTLKQHQRTHTEERPYHCPQCGKSFIYSCRLKKHQATHTE